MTREEFIDRISDIFPQLPPYDHKETSDLIELYNDIMQKNDTR